MKVKHLFLQEKKKSTNIKSLDGYKRNVELVYIPCSLFQAQIVKDSISDYYNTGVLSHHEFLVKSHGNDMYTIVADYVEDVEDESFMIGFCNGTFFQVIK